MTADFHPLDVNAVVDVSHEIDVEGVDGGRESDFWHSQTVNGS